MVRREPELAVHSRRSTGRRDLALTGDGCRRERSKRRTPLARADPTTIWC